MDGELNEKYIVVKGYIDAKDEKNRSLCGTFVSIVSRRDVKFLSVMFTREELEKNMAWTDLLLLHEKKNSNPDREPYIGHQEELLHDFLNDTPTLNTIIRNLNAKSAEQSISRFCLDRLNLKAVCLIDFHDATDSDMQTVEESKEYTKNEPAAVEETEQASSTPSDSFGEDKPNRDIFIKCNPILDPVLGRAATDLRTGDYIYGKLPEDSVFYKLLARNVMYFDGIVTAQISGILINELGTATVSLDLSDGVAGVMKISSNVRIKVPKQSLEDEANKKTQRNIPPEAIFGAAGLIIVCAALYLIFYIFM